MGWPKYAEDNREIMLERLDLLENRKHKTEIKTSCNNSLPLKKISGKGTNGPTICTVNEPPTFEDKYIICMDCGRKFLFSAQTQKLYKSMGWDNPKRCKKCRDLKNIRYLMHSSR